MQQITAEHLLDLQRNHEDLLLVNTLPKKSFEKTAIHGSINIPQDDPGFAEEVKRHLGDDQSRPVVVYCASAACDSSRQAAEKLDNAGVKQVLEFTDGYQGWTEHLENEHVAGS